MIIKDHYFTFTVVRKDLSSALTQANQPVILMRMRKVYHVIITAVRAAISIESCLGFSLAVEFGEEKKSSTASAWQKMSSTPTVTGTPFTRIELSLA